MSIEYAVYLPINDTYDDKPLFSFWSDGNIAVGDDIVLSKPRWQRTFTILKRNWLVDQDETEAAHNRCCLTCSGVDFTREGKNSG